MYVHRLRAGDSNTALLIRRNRCTISVTGRIPEHIVEQIVRSADMVRIVGRYCDLKQRSGRFWACCPFHEEKTPSFSLDAENGLYYCFGCKEGGNVFSFLEKTEGLSFYEALERLATDAGVDLSRYRTEGTQDQSEITRLRELNELATGFYEKCLRKAKGGDGARDYLAGRSITSDTIEKWRIGYAPEGWEHFLRVALKRGYSVHETEVAGLALSRREGPGAYDRFRGRLMFPISDAQGRTIGFGARALKPEDEPKYLNTPDTPLFNKGRNFFGLANARHAIRSANRAVILEGYTDVIMAHQAGSEECVAVLGTALTSDHARYLTRLAEQVVLVFDGDEAGQRSASRSIEVLLNEDFDIRVATLPDAMDPCEYIVAHGGDAFRQQLDQSIGFFEFRLAMAHRDYDTSTLEGRNAAFDDLAELALCVRDEVRRDMIVRWIAQELGVRETMVWAVVDRRSARSRQRQTHEPGETHTAEQAACIDAEQCLPRELLGLLLVQPGCMARALELVDLEELAPCAETAALKDLAARYTRDGRIDKNEWLASLDGEVAASAARAVAHEEALRTEQTEEMTLKRLQGYAAFLDRRAYQRRVAATTAGATDVKDDALLDYYRKRLEKDRKSAQ